MSNSNDFELIDTSWNRQRGPVERNIYIRSGRVEELLIAKRRARWYQSILVGMIMSFLFGFGFVAMYAHVIASQSFYSEGY